MQKRTRLVITSILSLAIIGTTLVSACKSNGGNTDNPGGGNTYNPAEELGFDPFSDEIYGEYLSDMDWESNSLAGWVNNDFPQGHLLKDKTTIDTKLTVKIGNTWRSFDKGLFTHAEANVYYNVKDCN